MDWGDEHDALLRKLCGLKEKLSAPEIAKRISQEFGIEPPLTRAAIIGRARRKKIALPRKRNGWETRGKWSLKEPPKPTLAPTVPIPRLVYDATAINPRPPVERPIPRQSRRGSILPEPEGVPGIYLLNAADGDCRMPLGEPTFDMRVCGDPTVEGTSYCVHCIKRTFTAAEPGGGIFNLPTNTQRGLR